MTTPTPTPTVDEQDVEHFLNGLRRICQTPAEAEEFTRGAVNRTRTIPDVDEQTRASWARAALAALDRWRTETDPR